MAGSEDGFQASGLLPWTTCIACRHCRIIGHGGLCGAAAWQGCGDVSRRRQCLYFEVRKPGRRKRDE